MNNFTVLFDYRNAQGKTRASKKKASDSNTNSVELGPWLDNFAALGRAHARHKGDYENRSKNPTCFKEQTDCHKAKTHRGRRRAALIILRIVKARQKAHHAHRMTGRAGQGSTHQRRRKVPLQ